jgi:hypothetical protein
LTPFWARRPSALGAELTDHLGYEKGDPAGRGKGNSRNGTSSKTVLTEDGEVEIAVPRDRAGSFEPQLIAKGQTRFDGFDDKILSLYARGMTVREIQGYDDAFSPPKTVEQARKLVENDEVLLIFQSVGTAPNTAIQRYMNARKVPQLFVATGATKWNDPQHFPWTMGWGPNYQHEARIYANYLLKTHPQGKIGILYQNDDFGKDFLKGLTDGG